MNLVIVLLFALVASFTSAAVSPTVSPAIVGVGNLIIVAALLLR